MRFSLGHGHKPVKSAIQTDSIDADLLNSLWNALALSFWRSMKLKSVSSDRDFEAFCTKIWVDYFKRPLDSMPDHWTQAHQQLQEYFYSCQWYEVYDFIEFCAQNASYANVGRRFASLCNESLEREVSGYRFIDMQLVKIVAEVEKEEIEGAISGSQRGVQKHLKRSLELLADRKAPDYRNSIKESISAIESLVKHLGGSKSGTLGDLMDKFDKQRRIHPALKSAFSKLYGYTSDEDGIRHSLLDEDKVTFEDAKFMLVACSAFVNYIVGRSEETQG